ncbi:MAG: U32 family peptidase [Verrucomicrobia subdivision 3 bacterium]|nr:U32 family peptidase [Limisphaerales bacterium]
MSAKIDTYEARPKSRARVCPELLAPAGNWDCARAAVENGADAIYFGLGQFNARMRAANFTDADLPKLLEYLHRRGVRGYVTFNTLVFANELAEAEQHLRAIVTAGADAIIVQDVGICRLIRRISPDFPIHASTQMTITSAAGVEFARELGCELVVLARECSLAEIEKIRQSTRCLPLEVFVHGALCVAYSGQCLTSEALGGRSANRGECAQACRMPYTLVSDGKTVPLGDRQYLLSPQDLAGLEVLPELVKSGVASLKIEGRLKTPEYVANITRVYRQALDRLCGSAESNGRALWEQSRYDLEMGFSRGLFTGWFRGINNQQLVHARFGKKRGVYLGAVSRVEGSRVAIHLEGPLKPGDGVVFDAGHPDRQEEGGRVYSIDRRGGEALMAFGHGDVNLKRIHRGDKVWKTSDAELDRRLRQSFAGDQPRFQRPIYVAVHGREGEPLTVMARDELGHVTEVHSGVALVRADKQPLTQVRLMEQFGRLGGTPFRLGRLDNHLPDGLIAPVSELNRLRRELAEELERQRAQPKRWTIHELSSDGRSPGGTAVSVRESARSGPRALPELIVLVRGMAQLEAALGCGIRTLYCEFEDPKKYRDAVARFREWQSRQAGSDAAIFVAPPRIFKTGEEWILNQIRSCGADGYLVRNYNHLRCFADSRRIGDFSLNVANGLTAGYFIENFGLERVTASYDLNFTQLEALLTSSPPAWYEVTIHQHMPMFHMEHCILCAFLSEGTDYTNCGRPCDKHDVRVRDRVGAEHPLKADAGCRNTVFNALAQTGAEYAQRMVDLGVAKFRLEFLQESPEQLKQTVVKYRQLLRGEITGGQLWRELKLWNQLGVTRGATSSR